MPLPPLGPWANPQLLAERAEKHAGSEHVLFCFVVREESRLQSQDGLGNSQL